MSVGDFKPTQQAIAFKEEVTQAIDQQLQQFEQVMQQDVSEFNQLVKEKDVDAVTTVGLGEDKNMSNE